MVIDEGQQYGTDREIAVISLMRQQDSEQTPGGIDRAARNAKRSRQLLLFKKHGLRSDRNYCMPANLADAMIRLLDGSSNEGLTTLSQILRRGQHTLGQLWTSQLSPQATEDLKPANTVLPALRAQFEPAQTFFFDRRPLPFGGSHLRLPSGPAGIRTTTGSLSALARPTPYQRSHRVAF